jgi:acyl-CoA thioester hydrolase
VQEIAIAHWESAAEPEDRAALYWVITRHEIDYLRAARPGDDVLLRTWVGVNEGRTYERHTEILRATTGKLLARARTLWIPMDRERHRPARVRSEVQSRFSIPTDPS